MLPLISIEAAVAAFSQARAPGIYKGDYLKELFRRYGEEEDTPPAPALPEWCFDDDGDGEVDDDGNAVGQESGPSSSGSAPGKRKKEKLKLVRLLRSSMKWTVKWRICWCLSAQGPHASMELTQGDLESIGTLKSCL